MAAPRDEISQAVLAGGATDAAHASRDVFRRAFTAVAVRINPRDLPDYAAAAIQMRPELAAKIIGDTIRVMTRRDRALSCPAITRLVRVTIAANPDRAMAITAAAIRARPGLASCTVAAAIAVLPEQRSQLASLESYYSVALVSLVTGDSETEPWHGSGTLNPANLLDFRPGGEVISPEQPPSAR